MIWSYQLAFDCPDPTALCSFWHVALGYGERPWLEDHAAFIEKFPEILGRQGVCEDAQRRHPRLFVQRVPEAKSGRNRIRPELTVPAGDLDRLVALGATDAGDGTIRDSAGN